MEKPGWHARVHLISGPRLMLGSGSASAVQSGEKKGLIIILFDGETCVEHALHCIVAVLCGWPHQVGVT